jgi:hypothetical protein
MGAEVWAMVVVGMVACLVLGLWRGEVGAVRVFERQVRAAQREAEEARVDERRAVRALDEHACAEQAASERARLATTATEAAKALLQQAVAEAERLNEALILSERRRLEVSEVIAVLVSERQVVEGLYSRLLVTCANAQHTLVGDIERLEQIAGRKRQAATQHAIDAAAAALAGKVPVGTTAEDMAARVATVTAPTMVAPTTVAPTTALPTEPRA